MRSSASGSVVDTATLSADWSHYKSAGAGPYNLTYDPTKIPIFEIRFPWLGVGDVEWYLNGVHVHSSRHAGLLAVPYMATAVLPITVRLENTGAATRTTAKYVCASLLSCGGTEPPFETFGWTMPAAITCPNSGTPTYLFSMRLKSQFPAASGITNRMTVFPKTLSFSSEGQRGALYVVFDPTLGGSPTWAVDPSTLSGLEIDALATATATGGIQIRELIPQNESINWDLSKIFAVNGRALSAGGIVTIMGEGEAGASSDIRGSVVWDEVR